MGHPASRSHWSRRAHSWTGPYKVLLAGPGKAPDGDLVGRNPLLLDTSHEHSRRINARVSAHRCKRCYNPPEGERRSPFLPWATSSYVLNKCSDPSPPFHLTVDDANMETDSYRVTPRSIVSHRILRGFSETVSVQYLTSWNELERLLGKRSKIWNSMAMWWSVIGRVNRASWRRKREISSVSRTDDKTVASTVSRRGICAARAQA